MIGGLFPVRAGVTSVGSVVLLLVAVRSSLVELGVRLGLVAGCLGRGWGGLGGWWWVWGGWVDVEGRCPGRVWVLKLFDGWWIKA